MERVSRPANPVAAVVRTAISYTVALTDAAEIVGGPSKDISMINAPPHIDAVTHYNQIKTVCSASARSSTTFRRGWRRMRSFMCSMPVRSVLVSASGAASAEGRTNAVTGSYAEGYHIDFAVYRTYTDAYGQEYIEHASTERKRRDPMEVNKWFATAVVDKSPKAIPAVSIVPKAAAVQMRRMVRYGKWFCRSRLSWSLPGGRAMSALVAEVYRAGPDRNDRSLYYALAALKTRVDINCHLYNSISGSADLTTNEGVLHQVKWLQDNLGTSMSRLSILFDQRNCTREKARFA